MGTALVRAATGEVVNAVAPFDMGTYLADLRGDQHFAQQKALAAVYDAACAALIGPNDVQIEGKGPNARKFKKKSAWRKLARHFTISTDVVKVEKEDLNGIFVAIVTVRATAPWGQYAEEIGACATDEATGRREISIADALATAATRATNRAVSNLIAMGEVSAEEIGDRPAHDGDQAPEPAADAPSCPKCGGAMWDNRQTKRNSKAPDYKCRDRSCDGVIWPPKAKEEGEQSVRPTESATPGGSAAAPSAAGTTSATTIERDLGWAAALPLMASSTARWDGHGRKPIGEAPDNVLKQARHFFKEKTVGKPADDRLTQRMTDQVAAIDIVLTDREANSDQEKLPLDAAAAPASDAGPAPTPPASATPDDDLPF